MFLNLSNYYIWRGMLPIKSATNPESVTETHSELQTSTSRPTTTSSNKNRLQSTENNNKDDVSQTEDTIRWSNFTEHQKMELQNWYKNNIKENKEVLEVTTDNKGETPLIAQVVSFLQNLTYRDIRVEFVEHKELFEIALRSMATKKLMQTYNNNARNSKSKTQPVVKHTGATYSDAGPLEPTDPRKGPAKPTEPLEEPTELKPTTEDNKDVGPPEPTNSREGSVEPTEVKPTTEDDKDVGWEYFLRICEQIVTSNQNMQKGNRNNNRAEHLDEYSNLQGRSRSRNNGGAALKRSPLTMRSSSVSGILNHGDYVTTNLTDYFRNHCGTPDIITLPTITKQPDIIALPAIKQPSYSFFHNYTDRVTAYKDQDSMADQQEEPSGIKDSEVSITYLNGGETSSTDDDNDDNNHAASKQELPDNKFEHKFSVEQCSVLADWFHFWDTDRDGHLDAIEFQHMVLCVGIQTPDVDTFARYDRDKDDKLNFREYLRVWNDSVDRKTKLSKTATGLRLAYCMHMCGLMPSERCR